ncbi:MFS transporter [Brevibacillus ginsengisoli]|uniref:MFS transporter n=1 Tax=Brevibacillus ginsengisoli TaxID=363854 RepID=UPI003CEC9035
METRHQVIRLALITAAALLGDSFLYIALPLFWHEAGLNSLWQVGILLAINRFIRLPLHPLVGWFYQKVSIWTGLRIAVGLAVITTVGCSLVHTFGGWLLFRALWGVAWTLLRQGSYLHIHHVSHSGNQGYLNGLFNGFYRLGSLFGMAAGGILCEWITYDQVLQGFALLMLPGFWLIRRSGGKGTIPLKGNIDLKIPRSRRWRNREMAVLLTSMVIALIYQGMFTSTISRLVAIHVGDQISVGKWLIGASSIAGVLQGLRWGWEPWIAPWIGKKADQTEDRHFLFGGVLIGAAFLFIGILSSVSIPIWLLMVLALLFTASLVTTLVDALMTASLTIHNRHRFLPSYTWATDIGATLGPIIGFWLPEQTLLLGAACLLVGLAGYWMYIRGKTVHTTFIGPSDQ